MFERLESEDLGEIGFVVKNIVKKNRTPELFDNWIGSDFKPMLKAINSLFCNETKDEEDKEAILYYRNTNITQNQWDNIYRKYKMSY